MLTFNGFSGTQARFRIDAVPDVHTASPTIPSLGNRHQHRRSGDPHHQRADDTAVAAILAVAETPEPQTELPRITPLATAPAEADATTITGVSR